MNSKTASSIFFETIIYYHEFDDINNIPNILQKWNSKLMAEKLVSQKAGNPIGKRARNKND